MSDQDRLHALDAVRAFALLLGIAFHAAIAYIPGFPKGAWAVVDVSPSQSLAVFVLVSHIFRMTLFFFIAGYFARLLVERHGVSGFLRNRRQRILIPFVVGWLVLTPITLAVFVVGIMRELGGVLPKPPPAEAGTFPLLHLWFLYILMILYGVTLLVRQVIHWIDRGGGLRALLDRCVRVSLATCLAPVLLAIPLGLGLATQPKWGYAEGIRAPDHSLIPTLASLLAYGTAILFGWLVHRERTALAFIQRRWPIHLAIALAANIVLFNGIQSHPGAAAEGTDTMIYALLYGIATWCWTLSITGVALTFCAGYSPVRRYLADASYWMYLAHLPLVIAIGVWLGHWHVHWGIKYPLTLAMTFLVLLASYHYLVRNTFIGRQINGRRIPIRSMAGVLAQNPTSRTA